MALRISDVVSLGVLGLATGATAIVYDQLPERMATHFDLHGNPNGWMPREMGAWFGPVFGIAMWALVRFAPRILPVKGQTIGDGKMAVVAAMTAVFMTFVHTMILRASLRPEAPIMPSIWVGVGLFIAALGLVMPRVGRNAFVGIRTAWTLASDENWARTHRVAGYSMVLGGLATALLGLGGAATGPITMVCLFVSLLVPVIYSAVLARRHV